MFGGAVALGVKYEGGATLGMIFGSADPLFKRIGYRLALPGGPTSNECGRPNRS